MSAKCRGDCAFSATWQRSASEKGLVAPPQPLVFVEGPLQAASRAAGSPGMMPNYAQGPSGPNSRQASAIPVPGRAAGYTSAKTYGFA